MNEMQTTSPSQVAAERTPALIGAEIRQIQAQARAMTVLFAVEAGRRLVEAKALVKHGEWSDWVKTETDMSMSSASRLMKIYEEYGADQIGILGAEAKSPTLQNLTVSNALRLLAIPEEEREAFAEEHDAEHLSARELDKILAEKKLLEAGADAAEKRAQAAEASLAAAKDNADRLRLRLEEAQKHVQELESRPIEVAVEKDEEAVKQAAEAAKAEAQKEIEQLEKKLAAAEKKQQKAEEAAKAAEDKLQTAAADATKERDAALKELEALKLQLAQSDPTTVQFRVVFESVQDGMNDMLRLIRQSDGEKADKLRAITKTLLDQFGKQVAV